MKQILTLFLTFTLLIVVSGCDNTSNTAVPIDSDPVVINLPSDHTINGYRDDTVSDEQSSRDTTSSQTNISTVYCGNSKSKVFHKASCASAKKMKEENRVTDDSREFFIENGYTPCKLCQP